MPEVDERIKDALRSAAGAFEPVEPLSLPGVRNRARVLRARVLIGLLILALFIASGAFIATTLPTSSNKGSLIGPSKTVSKDPNYDITVAVTKKLADGAAIPPRSVRSATPPIQNHSLGPEMPAGNNHFVDTTRWWIVPMSVRETVRWLSRHGPPNVRYSVGESGGDGSRLIGFHISDDTSQAYMDRAIQYSMAAIDGGHTAVRVDGTAIWLTSTPVPDRLGAPAIRITAVRGCPTSLAGYHDVSNPRSEDLMRQVVPSADPTAALVCRYETRSPSYTAPLPKFTPVTALGSSGARKLALQLRTLKVGFGGGGIGSCPQGLITLTEIVVLSYPDRPDVDLWYGGGGCRSVIANGFVLADDPIAP